jgi:hypothetical protein
MKAILREVLAVHLRLAKALVLAVLEYFVGVAWALLRKRRPVAPVRRRAPAPSPAVAPSPAAAPAQPPIVLEAAVGERAVAAFAVANHSPEAMEATFALSPFRDAAGAVAPMTIEIDPPRVSLEAAQQVVVRIAAAVTDTMTAAAAYTGFLTVPGVAEQPIAVIVRRTA